MTRIMALFIVQHITPLNTVGFRIEAVQGLFILTLDLVLLTMIFRYDPDMTQVIPIKLVTLHVPETYVDGLEKLVQSNLYPNRSEAIRIAIRDLLKRELWGT